jgi:5-(carboxyamino)imidazole ribonucleotide synthase
VKSQQAAPATEAAAGLRQPERGGPGPLGSGVSPGDAVSPKGATVGMIGAGQLARMTCPAATGLAVRFRVLAAAADESAAQVCADTVLGDHRSAADVLAFAGGCDVVTFDHEHVPAEAIEAMESAGHAVRPGSQALRFAQDKRAMRERLATAGIACPRWASVGDLASASAFAGQHGWPVVLKAVTGGYDGKGVWVCGTPEQAAEVLSHGLDLIAEEHVRFERELAILVARSPAGQGAAYPVVQTVQADGVCREVLAPAPGLRPGLAAQAQQIGLRLAAELDVTGVLAVELFEADGELLVNELAMRPHNSGHWTIDGAVTSQFEQHLRAVLNLPLGQTRPLAPVTVMVNVLGGQDGDLHGRLTHVMAADPGIRVQLYGKPVRPGRKVGHVTALGSRLEPVRARARRAASYLADGVEDETAAAAGGSGGRPPGQHRGRG